MVANLFPYPEYRESIVPWLDRVPEHWQTRQLRTLASEPIRNGVGESAQPFRPDWPRYIRITDIAGPRALRTNTRASLPLETAAGARVKEGDLLLAAVGATYGKSYLHRDVGTPACFAGYLVRLSPNAEVSPEFLSYWTESAAYWDQVNSQVIQSTIQNFSAGRYKGLRVPLPPLEEQAAIVRFLEYADRRIRRFIAAKKELIALLNEQKRAIIHRAVTRGLDPSAHLKASGLEWLGDIPAHWEVRRNGQLFAQRNQKGFGELPILEVSLKTGVRVREFADTDRKQVMSDREQYKRAEKGDIAYNMMRMWQGAVGIALVDGLVSPAYVVARPRKSVVARYFTNLFRTAAYMGEVDNASRGIVKDRNRLYWEDFKQLHSPYPPPDEQERIVAAIDTNAGAVTAGIERVEREIALLREYRTRLIADVVTGKLDVREAAVRLPDEVDEVDEPGLLDDMDGVADQDGSDDDAEPDAVPEQAEA